MLNNTRLRDEVTAKPPKAQGYPSLCSTRNDWEKIAVLHNQYLVSLQEGATSPRQLRNLLGVRLSSYDIHRLPLPYYIVNPYITKILKNLYSIRIVNTLIWEIFPCTFPGDWMEIDVGDINNNPLWAFITQRGKTGKHIKRCWDTHITQYLQSHQNALEHLKILLMQQHISTSRSDVEHTIIDGVFSL